MNNINYDYPIIREVAKIQRDLVHLSKVGNLLYLEIDLNQGISVDDEVLQFIAGTEGVYYLAGDIFINLAETDIGQVALLLNILYVSQHSLEIIDSIVVQMRSKRHGKSIQYSVIITLTSSIPSILSIEDHSIYFEFVPSFRMIWEMTA